MSNTLARVVTVLLFSAKQTTGERCDGRRECVCVWARRDWAAAAVAFRRIRRYMYGDDDDNDDTGNDDDDDDDGAKSLEHDGWRERAERTGCGRLSQSSQVEMPPQDWLRPSGVRVPRAMKDED